MALDYKDPLVAKEYASLQSIDTEDVIDELATCGIVAPPTMNDMDMRMMLVEMRMRKAGTYGGAAARKKPERPASFASEFERVMFEKPAFKALYEEWQATRNTNALNLASEHINNPKRAKDRYAGTEYYDKTIAEIEAAIAARVEQEVTTPTLFFSGFPSNMGEAGVKMTLQAFGEVVEFTVEESDDGMTLGGRVEYTEVSAAKAAIDKYDGVDMGLGTQLELQSY